MGGRLRIQQANASAHLWFTDEIIMAAPLRITDVTSGLLGGEDGRVYIYNGKHTTLGDMTGKCKSWMTPCPEEKVKVVYGFHSMMREVQLWLTHLPGVCRLAAHVLTAVLDL